MLAVAKFGTIQEYYFNIASIDCVFAVHSPYWPDEVSEWVTRKCSYGFPRKLLLRKVVRYLCDFVNISPKGHPEMKDVPHGVIGENIYWRFSFSMAEYLLIQQWKPQIIVYRTIHRFHKIILSQVDNSNMSTYYFKILMFWAYEGKPPEFWLTDSLKSSICEFLNHMIVWMEELICPNYFIPENNMMSHLNKSETESYRTKLLMILTSKVPLYHSELLPSTHNELTTNSSRAASRISAGLLSPSTPANNRCLWT